MCAKKEHQKIKLEYGYYIDEDGLYFHSMLNGETYELFDINGVASTTFDFGTDFEILELAYIYED
tara:strand:- start:138 stop:332 length:195 start_codon:yes stop_codon:yes gene_type:complete